jgi:alpha- and gamma-adaptin-binding protein p34
VGQVVKQGLGGWEWDGVGLAVAVGEGATEEWDEACAEAGLELVQVTGKAQTGRNEFGGSWSLPLMMLGPHSLTNAIDTEKSGIPRVKEALESNDWAQLDDDGPLSDFGEFEDGSTQAKEDDPENMDFGYDKADFEGLKKAIWENSLMNDDGDFDASTGKKGAASTDKEKDGADEVNEDSGKAEMDDDDVVKVERMMAKLQSVREAGEGMGEEQRKKMAARAVCEVLADLDS